MTRGLPIIQSKESGKLFRRTGTKTFSLYGTVTVNWLELLYFQLSRSALRISIAPKAKNDCKILKNQKFDCEFQPLTWHQFKRRTWDGAVQFQTKLAVRNEPTVLQQQHTVVRRAHCAALTVRRAFQFAESGYLVWEKVKLYRPGQLGETRPAAMNGLNGNTLELCRLKENIL